jgi:hypothetical protein
MSRSERVLDIAASLHELVERHLQDGNPEHVVAALVSELNYVIENLWPRHECNGVIEHYASQMKLRNAKCQN